MRTYLLFLIAILVTAFLYEEQLSKRNDQIEDGIEFAFLFKMRTAYAITCVLNLGLKYMHKARCGEISFSISTLAILNCFMLEATSSHPYGFSQSTSLIMKARNQAKKLFFTYYERNNI